MKLSERDVVRVLKYIENFKWGYQNGKFETYKFIIGEPLYPHMEGGTIFNLEVKHSTISMDSRTGELVVDLHVNE